MSSVISNPTTSNLSTSQAVISAENVAAWLSNNPAFFIGRENLLASLELDHACGDSESLLLYQLKIMREELKQHKKNHEQLLSNARDNEKRLKRIERLLVKLLAAENLDELISLLEEELQHNFALPHLVIWNHSSIGNLPKASKAQEEQQLALLANKLSANLQLDADKATLLGLEELKQGSAIICRLNHTQHLGLLVLAHPSSQHFRQQDTLFIEYLAAILSSLVQRHQLQG